MGDHYGDESQSASDQEELVGGSDLDGDISDTEEMQFSFCKASMNTIDDHDSNSCTNFAGQPSDEPKSKLIFFGMVVILFLTAFVLLICFPLYFQQLNAGGSSSSSGTGNGNAASSGNGDNTGHNAYGALLYISTLITSFFLLATVIASWSLKWDLMVHKFPLPWKRLLTISSCCGIAGTVCIICSYQRVPCHLQDPLKGAALVYALVFYFFFCRKTMGLQKIFSATTAVVGLFISVDYGLCDEFRCRGIDITITPSYGWQGRAVWTLVYVAGIALWTLHLSLLEGDIVTCYNSCNTTLPSNTLATVSRIVSSAETCPNNAIRKPIKRKPKSIHVAMWIHVVSYFIILVVGWIDIIPGSGPVQSVDYFLQNTGRTFLCHLNINYKVPETSSHQATLEFLSNLTPGSYLYNQTVQKLRRNKRLTEPSVSTTTSVTTTASASTSSHHKNFIHKRINSHKLPAGTLELADEIDTTVTNKTVHIHLNATAAHHQSSTMTSSSHTNNNSASNANASMHKKINTEKYRQKYKNYLKSKHKILAAGGSHNQTPIKVSELVLNPDPTGHLDKCNRLQWYSLLFAIVYVLFAIAMFEFLFMSESAVFTIAIISATLPVGGVFWSMFKLTTKDNVALIIWSPEITGELICSLLGTPIVILGLILLCTAHFNETASNPRRLYTSLSSRDP